MFDEVKEGLDTASSLLGGPDNQSSESEASTPTFFNADDLGESGGHEGGAYAPHDVGQWDNAAIIEFIHFGGVHLDHSDHFHHDELADDEKIEDFGHQPRSRAIMFRAALEREALLLGQFMFACQSVMKEKEESQGGLGEMVDMAADYLGGGSGSGGPSASDVNAFIEKVAEVGGKLNNANVEYKMIHQAGIDLHQARADYRAYLNGLLNNDSSSESGGMLSEVSALSSVVPVGGDIVGLIQGIAFKMFDIYFAMYLKIALQQEERIEKVDRRLTVKSILENHSPFFPVWFPEPEGDDSQNGDGNGNQAPTDNPSDESNWLEDLAKPITGTVDDVKKEVDEVREKVTNFLNTPSVSCPGDAFLSKVFSTSTLSEPSALQETPRPPKPLGDITVEAFTKALDDVTLPDFVKTIITEICTMNAEFMQTIYQKLMQRDGSQPIQPEPLYEAARERLLQKLVGLLTSKVSFLQEAKDFSIGAFGTSIKPGEMALDKGQTELNERLGSHLDPVLAIAMENFAMQLEGARKQAIDQKCHTMEVYLGILPWMYAQVFRDTFFPFWDILVDNTFGRIGGPLGDAVQAAKKAMKDAQKQVDKARDWVKRGEAVGGVVDDLQKDGLKAGLDGQNVSGYKDKFDEALNEKADRSEGGGEAPAAEYKYPIEGRLTKASGKEIKLSEYREVEPNNKWQVGELAGLHSDP